MKKIAFLLLLPALFMINGCYKNTMADDHLYGCETLSHTYEMVFISIQDVLGSDLIAGLEYDWAYKSEGEPEGENSGGSVCKSLYSLEFEYPNPKMCILKWREEMTRRGTALFHESPDPYPLVLDKVNGQYYFRFQLSSVALFVDDEEIPPADMITIKLQCPYVFGDDAAHTIVFDWKTVRTEFIRPNSDEWTSIEQQVCSRIVFDGRTIPFKNEILFAGERIIGGKVEYVAGYSVALAEIILDRD